MATDLSPAMLALAKDQIKAANVTFQVEDCQKTSFLDAAFDTAFMGLVIHLTAPEKTLAEMRRILKPGGTLIIVNVDPGALTGLDRIRGKMRILYHGITGYRVKPPRGFAKNTMTETQLCDLMGKFGFEVVSTETIKDTSPLLEHPGRVRQGAEGLSAVRRLSPRPSSRRPARERQVNARVIRAGLPQYLGGL